MTEPAAEMTLEVSDVVTGVWCQTCALPSAWQGTVVGISLDGVADIGVLDGCTGCNPDGHR